MMYRNLVFWLFLLPQALYCQCLVDTSILMREKDTLNLTINIEGALNNNLSDPSQGVCKVRINFEHEFLGDLQVFLISPAGQKVQLLGPAGNFGLTQFSEWDVCFVPSSMAAVPDPGFSDRWSNNQLWGSFAGVYTGSYYPFFGVLEDVDMGPVNGTWTLQFIDRTIFYVGRVKGFQLNFCDSLGVMCHPCEPGRFDYNLPVDSACEGDSSLLFSLQGTYTDTPDEDIYFQRFYLIDSNDFVLDTSSQVDMIQYPPGKYQICGLSYYDVHDVLLPEPGEKWDKFTDSVRRGDLAVCLGFMDCYDITIHAHSDTVFLDTSICAGTSLDVFGNQINQVGRHTFSGSNFHGCDSTVVVDLELIETEALATFDTLDCSTASVILDGIPSIGNNLTYQWSTTDGNIVDTVSPSAIRVDAPGFYTLVVSQAGCTDTLTLEIIEDDQVPSALISGDTINCDKPIVEITGSTDAINATYSWRLNNLNISDNDSVSVSQGGRLVFTVMDVNGCTNSATFNVIVDTVLIPSKISYDTIDCVRDMATMQLENDTNYRSFEWRGPLGFRGTNASETTAINGWYYLQTIGLNGCIDQDSFEIIIDTLVPEIVLFGDTLSCTKQNVNLSPVITPGFSSIQWFDTSGPISNVSVLNVNRPGIYRMEVIGENGCFADTSVQVLAERDLLGIGFLSDSINCTTDRPFLTYDASSNIVSATWISPAGDSVESDSIEVVPGTYRLVVESLSGCTYVYDTSLIDYRNAYTISLTSDTLNCNNPNVNVVAVTNVANLNYEWSYGGSVVSNDSIFQTPNDGLYYVTVEDQDGCVFTDSLTVAIDTVPPYFRFTGDTLISCRRDSVFIQAISTADYQNVSWTGPSGFRSDKESIRPGIPGTYVAEFFGVNGCVAIDSIHVLLDTTLPVVDLITDTIDCISPVANLNARNGNPRWNYTWLTPLSDTLSGSNIDTEDGGTFRLTVTNIANGCSSLHEAIVEVDTISPSVMIDDRLLPCNGGELHIVPQINVSLDSILWKGPDDFESEESDPTLDQPGTYYITLFGENGCVTEDSVEILENLNIPRANVLTDTLTCRDTAILLKTEFLSNVDSFYWFDMSGMVYFNQNLPVNQSGEYGLVLLGQMDCTDTLYVDVPIDTVLPVVDIQKGGVLGCTTEVVSISISSLTQPNDLTFEWRPIGDVQINGDLNSRMIEVLEAGAVEILTIDESSGCEYIDTVYIEDLSDSIFISQLDIQHTLCEGAINGAIGINQITGGTPPYLINFNGLGFARKSAYDLLRPGNYTLEIIDALGCRTDTTIEILDGPPLSLTLGADTIIKYGDTIEIIPLMMPDSARLSLIKWSPADFLSSEDEVSPLSSPPGTITYTLTIRDQNGCTAQDDIRIIVDDDLEIFIPNSFTPNGDGLNDFATIFFGKGINRILQVDIFNRWGELIFRQNDLPASDGSVKWDGTFKNEVCLPGVYPILLYVETKDGQSRLISGDITLIR